MQATLITGASSGIGKELAKIFASKGHNLILVARRKQNLLDLKKELEPQYKIKAFVIATDLSNPQAPNVITRTLREREIEVNILVNNAGFGDYGAFIDSNIEKQEAMINVNITSLTKLTRLFLPQILKHKGKILNVESVAGFMPGPLMSVYYASKAYVISFTEAIAEELEGKVAVTALCPGPVKTEFAGTANANKEMFNEKISEAKDVAEYGYKSLMAGKTIAVHGAGNKILTKTPRLMPRKLIGKIVKGVHTQK